MPWHERFKRWLDRWLQSRQAADDESPDDADYPETRPETAERRPATPPSRRRSAASDGPRPLRLALQGGGAHGAFTWGVLDRLLDEPTLAFPRISGASAGALNGAALISGFATGGRAGAQKALSALWGGVGEIGALMAPLDRQQQIVRGLGLPGPDTVQAMMRMWSPAQLNPFNLNPLRGLLERVVDIDAVRGSRDIRLHVSATSVETGAARIFTGSELSIDVLMASACLPFLYHAVTIDGVAYWDGGYSSNPPLGPLVQGADQQTPIDVLLVQINPQLRASTPSTASAIMDRVNEITFNASLLAELQAFEAMLVRLSEDRRRVDEVPRLHRIALHDEVGDAAASTAGSLDASFHRRLRDHGRRAADRWLSGSWRAVVRKSDPWTVMGGP